ncbi:MAG TPA: hypothetical protein P5067_08455 [Candidatus Marinimicrobia bacterium]|nr:hypothetical protein [Candidatus Neomarinimicrobiota bacterium]
MNYVKLSYLEGGDLTDCLTILIGIFACRFENCDDSLERLSYGSIVLLIVGQAFLPVSLRYVMTA